MPTAIKTAAWSCILTKRNDVPWGLWWGSAPEDLVAGGEQGKDRGHLALWWSITACSRWTAQLSEIISHGWQHQHTGIEAAREPWWPSARACLWGPQVWAPSQGPPELPAHSASPYSVSGLSEKLERNLVPLQFSLAVSKLRITPINPWKIEKIPCTPACCLLCVVLNKAKAADGTCRHRGLFQGSSWPWLSRYHRWAARLFWFLFAKGEIGVFKCKYAIKWNLLYF